MGIVPKGATVATYWSGISTGTMPVAHDPAAPAFPKAGIQRAEASDERASDGGFAPSQKQPGGCRPQRLKEEDSAVPGEGSHRAKWSRPMAKEGPSSTLNPWCSSSPSRKPRGALYTKITKIWMKAISVELEQELGQRGQAPPPDSEVRGAPFLRQAEHSDGFKTWEPPRTTEPQDGLQPPLHSAPMTTSRPSLGRQRDDGVASK